MSTIERTRPITSTERQRQYNALHALPAEELHAQELHTTSDQQRIFRHHTHVGGTVDHGTVADAAAMAALGGTSSIPGTAPRGVWVGDTCWRSDEGVGYQCISGSDSTAEWRAVGVGSAELSVALSTLATGSAMTAALAGKWDTPSNASTLAQITSAGGAPLWNGDAWPGGSGPGILSGMPLVYADDFASLANWTQVAGEWSVSGGVLTKASSTGAQALLRLDLPESLYLTECVVTVEVSLPASPTMATYYGVVAHWDGTTYIADSTTARLHTRATDTEVYAVGLDRTSTEAYAARVLAGYLSPVPACTAWTQISYKLTGAGFAAFVGEKHCCGAHLNAAHVRQPYYIGFRCEPGGVVRFRSFKLYAPSLPATS